MEDTQGGSPEEFEPGRGMNFDQEAENAYAILRRGSEDTSFDEPIDDDSEDTDDLDGDDDGEDY